MRQKSSKVLVLLTVAFLMASPASVLAGEPWGDDIGTGGDLGATYNDYTAASTGLPSNGDYYYVKFGDLNGDGYEDLVAGAGQYPSGSVNTYGIWAYTYKTSGSWEKNSTDLPTTGVFAGLDLGDVDGDGDLDIVAGGEGWGGSAIKGVRVYVNKGTSGGKLDWDEVTGPETNNYYDQCVFADVNADGDLDIVAATKNTGVRVWLGNGGAGGTFSWTAKNSGLPTNGEYTGVAVADLNGDGDLDIVATDYSAGGVEVRLYTGDGTGNWTSRESTFPQGNSASFGVVVGDVNKDGDNDIIYGRNSGLRCLLGNGGGTGGSSFSWTAANTNLATSGRHAQLDLGDVDKDGDLDIVCAVVNGGVTVYLGNGGAGSGQSWTKVSKGLPTSGEYYGVALGDFNKDGVKDIGGAMWGSASTGGLRVWKGNVQSDYDPTAAAIIFGETGNETVAWLGEDVQLDGRDSSDPQDAPIGDSTGTKLTYDWNITVKPAGSALTDASMTPGDDNATPIFTPDRAGVYRLSLVVQDSAGNWSQNTAYVKVEVRKPNEAPVADAGEDQSVLAGELVYLNSSGSYDPDGELLAWQWEANAGNPEAVTLVGDTLPLASFVAPATAGVYGFNLTVRDDNNTWSEPDTVNVTVNVPPNKLPVAVAPNDFQAKVNEPIRLNGSGSYDEDGTIVAWDWNCTSHPALTIIGADAMVATFTAVLPARYNFTLTVQDDSGAWAAEDLVSVFVREDSQNVPPVAEISGPAVVNKYVGDDVVVDGSASTDEDGSIVEWLWNCTSHPTLNFTGQNTSSISFRPTEPGDYLITLAVMDDNMTWSLSEGTVTVRVTRPPTNSPPVAVINGPAKKVRPGDDVALDGSASYDRDGTVTAFNWVCLSHPTLTFTGQGTYAIRFNAADIGDYTFTLSVQDDVGDWSETPASYTVTVRTNVPPVANISGPSTGYPGDNITLSAAGSTDSDGTVAAWNWNCTSHLGLALNDSDQEEMYFFPPVSDTYVIVLRVMDDEDAWSAVEEFSLVIGAIDGPPTADAGSDQRVRMGVTAQLNGGGSSDYEGDIVAYRWRCTSHPTVPGLVNADQMVASFSPPEPGIFMFTLEVQDEAGQWSDPDSMTVTVLEQNSRPQVTINSPTVGTVKLDGYLLRIEWETYDANDDTLQFWVEVYQNRPKGEGGIPLAVKGELSHGTTEWSFNDTSYNFPRRTDLYVYVKATETATEDRYSHEAMIGPFQLQEDAKPPTNGGGDDDDGISSNTIIIAILVLVGIAFVGFIMSRGGTDEDEEYPWEDEGGRPAAKASAPAAATKAKAAPRALASPVAAPAKPAPQKGGGEGAARDPQGRLLDCPECGAPLDHDTDFGAPYCWDCDKYF